jgi:TonB family protein
LKEEAAANKYGEKGKDGVIEITTKRTNAQPQAISQKTVKGIVLKEDGQPLEGVNITSTGTTGNAFGATTGKDGHFEINNVQADASLLFFCRGYIRLSLKPDFNNELSVTMKRDPEYRAPADQRDNPLVVIDGVITDKSYRDVYKELGYNMGISKFLIGKEAKDKYGEKGANGVMEITTRKKALEMGLKPPFPRLTPDDYPTFQNQRWTHFREWVIDNVKYPSEAQTRNLEGWVTVNFTVELDGTISSAVPAGSSDPILSNEVLRVIKSSPKWEAPKNQSVDMPFTASVNVGFKYPDQIEKEEPFVVVEEMPVYPGGDTELLNFIRENTKYPDAAKTQKIQGKVIIRFIVNKEGNTEGITVLKGVDPLLDAEAVRVVSLLSGFKPGMQGGKAVPVWYMVPVNFALEN